MLELDLRTRWVQEYPAFQQRGQVFRCPQLHIGDGLGFLDLEVDADLRAVVRARPDGHRAVAAQQRVRRVAVAERDEMRLERPLRGLVGWQAVVPARRE